MNTTAAFCCAPDEGDEIRNAAGCAGGCGGGTSDGAAACCAPASPAPCGAVPEDGNESDEGDDSDDEDESDSDEV